MLTLVDLLEEAASHFADRPAVALPRGLRTDEWTYRRLRDSSLAVAAHLRGELGFRPGERVLVWAPNSPELVATYFGCMLARLVLVPIDAGSTETFVGRVAEATRASGLILGRGDEPTPPDLPAIPLASLPFDGIPSPAGARPEPEDIVEIVFTSGTTGAPKGVVLTHANVVANVSSGTETGVLPRSDRYRLLSLLPLSHMFEQTAGLYLPLSYGARVFYLPSRQPSLIFRAMARYRITGMAAVPLILDLMLRGVEREVRRRGRWGQWQRMQTIAERLPLAGRRVLFRPIHAQLGGSFEFFLCGGARLAPEIREGWERLGVRVIEGYGVTECAPIIASNTLDRRVAGTVGRPVSGMQVRLSGEGEVQVRGPSVMAGYWEDPAATRAAFTGDGWYRTGDLAARDRAGALTLRGRLRDLVVLPSGLNVYPEDVEQALRQEPEIDDAVVLGLPDAVSCRPRLHAVLLAAPGPGGEHGHERLDAAVRRANARLAPYQRVPEFSVWASQDFPRTTSMKVKRYEVAGVLRGVAPAGPSRSAERRATESREERLRRILAEVGGVPLESVQATADLGLDLHLDSLARVELAVRLEEELGVAVDESWLAEPRTIAELEALAGRAESAETGATFPRWALAPPIRWLRAAAQDAALFPLHALVCRPFRVEGSENLQGLRPPALFVANHTSHLDTPTVLRALPAAVRRRVVVAAAADYFYRDDRLGAMASLLLNTFPFSREGAVGASLAYCGEVVDAGWSLLIYPEGTRSVTGRLQPFKSGVGLLARELGVPVVPIALDGPFRILPKGRTWPRPGAVSVRIGRAISMAPDADCQRVAARLEAAVADLLERDKRGGPPERNSESLRAASRFH